jgi:TM2 domain-containing membrane protein YozV
MNTWQAYQQPFVPAVSGSPNPSAAAILGLIPGVGAMYNGQFFKGLIHVVIFAVLVSITEYHGIFGIFIGAWVLYQSFEAHHTAQAIRDGQPLPDPLGLNEVGNWLNLGSRPQHPGVHPGGHSGMPPAGQPPASSGTYTPPGAYQPPYTGGAYQPPYQSSYQAPYATPASGFTPVAGTAEPGNPDPTNPGGVAPGPDIVQPLFWRRKEPIGAIVLIALGLLFLLGQLDIFHGRLIEFAWPLLLIGVGVWLVVRRIGESQGGPK